MVERYIEMGWGASMTPSLIALVASRFGVGAKIDWELSIKSRVTTFYKVTGPDDAVEKFIDHLGCKRTYDA